MRKRNPFVPKAPHHLYIGIFILFLAWTMKDYDYYHPLCDILFVVGAYITIDDIIEHTITADTPLRILFEKVLVPLLIRLKLIK